MPRHRRVNRVMRVRARLGQKISCGGRLRHSDLSTDKTRGPRYDVYVYDQLGLWRLEQCTIP
jgi:hypothetical protein